MVSSTRARCGLRITIPRQVDTRRRRTSTGKRSSSWSPSQLRRYALDVQRVIVEFRGAVDNASERLDVGAP